MWRALANTNDYVRMVTDSASDVFLKSTYVCLDLRIVRWRRDLLTLIAIINKRKLISPIAEIA